VVFSSLEAPLFRRRPTRLILTVTSAAVKLGYNSLDVLFSLTFALDKGETLDFATWSTLLAKLADQWKGGQLPDVAVEGAGWRKLEGADVVWDAGFGTGLEEEGVLLSTVLQRRVLVDCCVVG